MHLAGLPASSGCIPTRFIFLGAAAVQQRYVGQTVTADEALLAFLMGSLGAKRQRLLEFAARPAARGKFLDLLYHQLGGHFRQTNIVARLPDAAWEQPAFRFSPPKDFGLPIASFRAGYAEGRQHELVVTADARYGYWREETYADSELLLIADY